MDISENDYQDQTYLMYGQPAILFPPVTVQPELKNFVKQLRGDYKCLTGRFTNDCCNNYCGRSGFGEPDKNPYLIGIDAMNTPVSGPFNYFGPPLVNNYRTYSAIPVRDEETCTRCLPMRKT